MRDGEAEPDWQFEGVVFARAPDPSASVCPAGTQPVYRFYNNGQGGAPNHRYTTTSTARRRCSAKGWIPEGYGASGS